MWPAALLDLAAIALAPAAVVVAGILRPRRSSSPSVPAAQGDAAVASPEALAAEGRFGEAGEAALEGGDHRAAADYFERAESWVRAGDAARQAGQAARAGTFYERAGALRLALVAYEMAGCDGDCARVAAQSGEPELLGRVAGSLVDRGDLSVAAELYRRAGLLSEAEKCLRALPGGGVERALEMHLAELERVRTTEPFGSATSRTARRAAKILDELGRQDEAAALRERLGLEAPPPAAGGRIPLRSSGVIRVPPREPDEALVIDSPITSADALFGDDTEDQTLDSPFASPEVFLQRQVDEGTITELDAAPPCHAAEWTTSGQPSAPSALELEWAEEEQPIAPAPSLFGDEVAERYELLTTLGVGGMGEVYTARDRKLGRTVALKFLSTALVGNDRAMAMFHREARAAAALNHPGIVTIYDLGVLDGRPFISMELLDGKNLGQISRVMGPFPPKHAARVAARIADALDFAHTRRVIHRDIKPANIVMSPKGNVTILDFGVAKAVQGGGEAASIVAGTPYYMAPEQMSQGVVDGRADLFALGVVLYKLLTGKRPFSGLDRSSPVTPPSSIVPAVPPALDEAVLRAIAPDPEGRFQKASDMAEALRSAAAKGAP